MQLRLVPAWLVLLMLVSHAQAVQAETESPRTEASASAARVEMGMLFGVVSRGADDTGGGTMIDLPGGEIPGPGRSLPALHVSWLAGERLAIGPEFAFRRTSSDFEYLGESFDTTSSELWLGGRAAFFPGSSSMPGIYLLGQGSLSWYDWVDRVSRNDGSETDYSAGFGMGYQWRIGPALLLRMEGHYRRWLDAEADVFSLVLGLGTRLGGG